MSSDFSLNCFVADVRCFSLKNLNASKPSEHSPNRGKVQKISVRTLIGYSDKNWTCTILRNLRVRSVDLTDSKKESKVLHLPAPHSLVRPTLIMSNISTIYHFDLTVCN